MYGWVLNTDLWLWQAIEWVQFRIPIVAQARRWQRPPLTARPPLQPPPGFVVAVEARPAPPAAALAGTVHSGCAALPGSCPEACPPAGQRSRRCHHRRHPRRPRTAPAQGYEFYLQMLYLFMTALILLLAGTAWAVRASRDPRAWQWPISLLRFCVFVYFEVCYVGVINVFFVAMDCQWLNGSPAMAEHMREYPDVGARP